MDSFKKAKIIKWLNYSQYFLISISCTLILVYEISVLVDKYLEKNTGTGDLFVKFDVCKSRISKRLYFCIVQADKYVHISKTPFPDLTICPTNPYKEEVLIKNGITNREDYRWNAKWNSNDSSISPKQLFESIGKANHLDNLLN